MATSTRRESSFEEPLHEAGEPDYYAILGLTTAASDEDIRQAYRSLAKRWHPDHYAMAPEEVGRQAERRMRAINRAHDVLGDPALRRDYDRRHGVGTEYTPHWSDGAAAAHRRQAYGYGQRGTFASHVLTARYDEHAHGGHTANGAGVLFALLSVILALAIGGRMLSSGTGSFIATSISLLAVMVLLGLAAFFATDDSLLARAATAYLEHEPKMAADTHTRRRTSGSGHASHGGQHAQYEHGAHESYEGRHPAFDEDEEPTPFEQLVDEALASIPEQFAEHMRNVVVRVKDEPDEEALRRMDVPPGHTLLGLYEGVPLTHQGVHGAQPEIVTIYQGPIERYCGHDADRMRAQVRATVVHELAHHFGIDHDDMPEWVK